MAQDQPAPPEELAPLEELRRRVRLELDRVTDAELVNRLPGFHADRIRDLADAYVTLGGDLELDPPPPPPRPSPRAIVLEGIARAAAELVGAVRGAGLTADHFGPATLIHPLREPLDALAARVDGLVALEAGGPA
jgi:hypothetical protein